MVGFVETSGSALIGIKPVRGINYRIRDFLQGAVPTQPKGFQCLCVEPRTTDNAMLPIQEGIIFLEHRFDYSSMGLLTKPQAAGDKLRGLKTEKGAVCKQEVWTASQLHIGIKVGSAMFGHHY